MELMGKSPISIPILILGKVAMFFCWRFFLVKVLNFDTMLYDSIATQILAAVFVSAGLFTTILALSQLRDSAAVGLPEQPTELVTRGMYRLSRNPMYVGGYFVCVGSCLFAVHIVNFLLFAVTFVIHPSIVRKEEEFLKNRFGTQWLEYMQRVPRYIGRFAATSK
ncbi:MAG: isoprenylcysteine carboxylmethyltransferase family protein [Bacteroidota bacterium]